MTFILNKFKSLAIGVMAVLFFMGMTLNSCSTQDKGSDTENLEAAAESEGEEHQEGEDEEHPEGEGEGEEHPEGEDEEHPEGEEKDKEEK